MRSCFECDAPADHEHHVIPRSLGGTRTVPLCGRCHGLAHGLAGEAWTQHRALTVAALARRKAAGLRAGEIPLGWTVGADGQSLVSDPIESKAVDEVYALRAEGLSVRAIADELNRRGVPARGARWHPTTVQRLLTATL